MIQARQTVGKLALPAALLVLAGCAVEAPVSGFRPVNPELTYSMNVTRAAGDILDWTKVDSLQPTFRWEPFPGTHQAYDGARIVPFVVVEKESVRDVTYDFKIWTVARGAPRELAYEREGLTEPSHHLERPLQPDTKYYWSVRARFRLDGKPRTTEWSRSSIPLPSASALELVHGVAGQTGVISPLNHYRFKTTAK